MNNISLNLQKKYTDFPEVIETHSLKEKVLLLIIRDLMRLDWCISFLGDKVEISPPQYYDKNIIKKSMSVKRTEILSQNQTWIDKHINFARSNLANGCDVLSSHIKPIVEVCNTRKQHYSLLLVISL